MLLLVARFKESGGQPILRFFFLTYSSGRFKNALQTGVFIFNLFIFKFYLNLTLIPDHDLPFCHGLQSQYVTQIRIPKSEEKQVIKFQTRCFDDAVVQKNDAESHW